MSPPPWAEARAGEDGDDADATFHAGEAAPPEAEPAGDDEPPSPPRRRGWLWGTGAALSLAALGGGGWYLWRGHDGAKPAEPAAEERRIPVQAAEAKSADLPIFLNSLGAVQALQTVTVRSRVDGEIVQLAFTEGASVRKGDLLAQIDPRPFQAALDQAVAKKAQDEATLESNQLDLERTRQLADRAFASQQSLDQRTATVGSLKAQVAIDQALIDNARTQLDYTAIRAPIDGRLGFRLVDQGNIVRATDTTGIVEITQIDPISVVFTAPEGQLASIAEAKTAGAVKVQAFTTDNKRLLGEGTLSLINNEVDVATGTVRLRAVFANPNGTLWPGLSVNTRLLAETLRNATLVPESAVMRGQNELYVFLVGADAKVAKRTITVGPYSEGRAVVESGLRAGERVVIGGQSRVRPGLAVQVEGDGDAKVAAADPPAAGTNGQSRN